MEKHEGKFLNGFVWGLLIGAGLVLLLTTKAGRRILKELSDAGYDVVDNLEDFDGISEEKVMPAPVAEEEVPQKVEHAKSSVKRFFKNIKKK